MKNITKLFFTAAFLTAGMASAQSGVGVGTTTPNASAALDVTSTTKGFLMPRMTTAQRTAIATPAAGLQVFDTDSNSTWLYDGTTWVEGATTADSSKWTNDATNTRVALTNLSDGTTVRPTGTEFVVNDLGSVGINTTTFPEWFSGYKQLKLGRNTSLAELNSTPLTFTVLGNNYYESPTGHKQIEAGLGSYYRQHNGSHSFVSTINDNGANGTFDRIFTMFLKNDGNVGIGTLAPTSKLHVVGLPTHVDNAAALSAGLTVGAFYHSGDGIVRVVF